MTVLLLPYSDALSLSLLVTWRHRDTTMDDDIYEDYEQTNKSTGSGLVLAVPAMVLDTNRSDLIDPSKPMVVTGSEYENLSPDNQYYEQVEFVRAVRQSPGKISDCDDSLYSIPQVLSANNSTTGLTTRVGSKVKPLAVSWESSAGNISNVMSAVIRAENHTGSVYVETNQHQRWL